MKGPPETKMLKKLLRYVIMGDTMVFRKEEAGNRVNVTL
jgi:hypothetical protein